MLASSDGSHTSEEGHNNTSKCHDKTSLEDIDKSLEGEELPQRNDISHSCENFVETPPQPDRTGVHNAQTGVPKCENSQKLLSSLPSSLRSSAQNQQSTSTSPSCQDPPETDGNPHHGIMPRSEDSNTSRQPHDMKGSKKQKPQLYTSVNGEKPQTLNTSDSIIPSFRNGRTSSHNTSQSEGQIQSRAQEEVITPQGYMYQPPPPPYPGKKRCYANTSPQEHCVNSHVVDA
jgi:hypothetical protein